MKNYFTISELCITTGDVPLHVCDKLLAHHIMPMNRVREALGAPVWASQHSGYRPKDYEISKGRSGNSQHTFAGLGAVDWTAHDLDLLQELILELTPYTRIARYNGFIHCDLKDTGGVRQLFESDSKSNWKFIKNL